MQVQTSIVAHCYTIGQLVPYRGQQAQITRMILNPDQTITYVLALPGDMSIEIEEYRLAREEKENPQSAQIEGC